MVKHGAKGRKKMQIISKNRKYLPLVLLLFTVAVTGSAVVRYLTMMDGNVNIVMVENDYELEFWEVTYSNPASPVVGDAKTGFEFMVEFIDSDPSQDTEKDTDWVEFCITVKPGLPSAYIYVEGTIGAEAQAVEVEYYSNGDSNWLNGGYIVAPSSSNGYTRLCRVKVPLVSMDDPSIAEIVLTFEVEGEIRI